MVLSADGKHDLFSSSAMNLAGTNGFEQIYLRDAGSQHTYIVSVDSSGNPGNQNSLGDVSVSTDGRYSFFVSAADNLVSGVTNGRSHCYRHDLETGETVVTDVSTTGQLADTDCDLTDNSDDGSYATFRSASKLLAPDATGAVSQIYLHDLLGGPTTRLIDSRSELNAPVEDYAISPDVRYIVFSTQATNVISGPVPQQFNCYVTDRKSAQTMLISVAQNGSPLSGPCTEVSISGDGSTVALTVSGSQLVPNDTVAHENVFAVTKNDQFTYTVSDGHGGTATGVVLLTEPLFGP